MANHWNRILLLGSLIFPLCYITVNGNITQNCTHFQTYSWRNILQRMDLKVQFMLLTRRNPSCAQPISDSNDIQNSNFNGSLPTKLIMHGYRVTGSKPSWVDTLAKELLGAMDVNVVIVDWIIGSTALYHNAVRNSIELGLKIAILIGNLMSHGSTEDSFHLIGISLGAHVAGFVGRMFKGKLGQITGLDPAGPEFSKASVHQRLDPGDAVFVEAIHSDSDKFGISRPVAHIDFYLNDGKDQPKCSQHLLSSVYKYLICDHIRAIYVYISSIKNHCPLVAFPCESYEHFRNGQCIDCYSHSLQRCPRIGLLERGGLSADVLPKEVKVYLMTSSQPPFCVKHFLLEIFYEQLGFHEQRIKIKFQSHSNASYLHLTIPKKQSNESTIRRVIPYDASFGNVNDVTIQLSSSWRRKRYPIHIEKLRIRELPLNDSERPPRCIYNIVLYREIIFEQLSNCL
ncbi:phospholipase A1 member A isoform X1 [Stegostoma tigrinum]|uniref:phospholipase A1 member A isoform X1 n=1 Tax=Stegostoma tigrinum TaxID=3053191 RepID=UPI0028703D6B|nr:phospholipase A1 member A isoform X1 [Stegostoma tigrinum]